MPKVIPPSDPEIGQVYYDVLQRKRFEWDGKKWTEIKREG